MTTREATIYTLTDSDYTIIYMARDSSNRYMERDASRDTLSATYGERRMERDRSIIYMERDSRISYFWMHG